MFFKGVTAALAIQLAYILLCCKNTSIRTIGGHIKEVTPVVSCMCFFHVLVQPLYKKNFNYPNLIKVMSFVFFTDFLMFFVHLLSHKLKNSFHHKHHLKKAIQWNDAFYASFLDKITLVATPLIISSISIQMNFLEYTLSGAIIGIWFVILHNENFSNFFENIAKKLLLGSFKTHSVHHLKPNKNFGHFVMAYDVVNGSYEYKHSRSNNE